MEEFADAVHNIDEHFSKLTTIKIGFEPYTYQMTIENLILVCSSLENLRYFMNDIFAVDTLSSSCMRHFSLNALNSSRHPCMSPYIIVLIPDPFQVQDAKNTAVILYTILTTNILNSFWICKTLTPKQFFPQLFVFEVLFDRL